MFFIGNRFKKSICLFLNPIVELLLFCLYMSAIPIKYVYTNGGAGTTYTSGLPIGLGNTFEQSLCLTFIIHIDMY